MRERDQSVSEQILRGSWSFSRCADPKRQVNSVSDMVNIPIGDQNLQPDVGVRYLERAEQRRDQCV